MRRREKYTPQYTYHEWLHWEERGELIKGTPIAKASRIGPKHEKAVAELKTALIAAITKADCKDCKDCKVGEPIDYKVSNDTILRPDVFVVCSKINKTYLDFPPVLIAEVISKATEERDRGIKFEFYEQQGVKYYLLVDAMKKSVEIFELINGKYELQEDKSESAFLLNNDCTIEVERDSIWK